jgi:cobalamin biosynthesis protein CobT
MKLKLRYFIRGLGIGIVFTAIVMSLSLQASRSRIIRENALTKDEIMEKAMGYGMIMDTSEDTNSLEEKEPSQDEQSQEGTQSQEKTQAEEENQDKKENQDKEGTQTQEENQNQEETKSDKESQEVEESRDDDSQSEDSGKDEVDKDKNESKKDDAVISIDYISIKITAGMSAASVGKLLEEKNIIDDSKEFSTYMSEQGYSSKILTGEHLIPVDATYKKIADIITRK